MFNGIRYTYIVYGFVYASQYKEIRSDNLKRNKHRESYEQLIH